MKPFEFQAAINKIISTVGFEVWTIADCAYFLCQNYNMKLTADMGWCKTIYNSLSNQQISSFLNYFMNR